MPRKSSDALTVVPLGVAARIPPPDALTHAQRVLWLAVTHAKPVDWFGEDSSPLLNEYVRAVCMLNDLEHRIRRALGNGEDPMLGPEIDKLTRLRDRESKRAIMLATKLRLTQQSRYTPQAAATANKRVGARLWE